MIAVTPNLDTDTYSLYKLYACMLAGIILFFSGVGSNKKVIRGHTNWQDEWVGPKAAACDN